MPNVVEITSYPDQIIASAGNVLEIPQVDVFTPADRLPDSESPCDGCPTPEFGALCLLHDATSGLWLELFGGNVPNCPGPYPATQNCAALAQQAANAANNATVSGAFGTTIGAFFEAGTETDWDYWATVCVTGDPSIPLLSVWKPPPKNCPSGQARDINGVCRAPDPPVPAGVTNLTSPTVARNPTVRGVPVPFQMKGCGCGEGEDGELYDPSLASSRANPGLPASAPGGVLRDSPTVLPSAHRRPVDLGRGHRVYRSGNNRILDRTIPTPTLSRGYQLPGG